MFDKRSKLTGAMVGRQKCNGINAMKTKRIVERSRVCLPRHSADRGVGCRITNQDSSRLSRCGRPGLMIVLMEGEERERERKPR